MDALEEMRDAIARYHSWQFKSDMADGNDEGDPVDAATAYEGTERAKADIQLFALASIAESLARIASTVGNVSFDLEQLINAVRTSPWQ